MTDDAGTCPECSEETRECDCCLSDVWTDADVNYYHRTGNPPYRLTSDDVVISYQDDDQRLGGHDQPVEGYYE